MATKVGNYRLHTQQNLSLSHSAWIQFFPLSNPLGFVKIYNILCQCKILLHVKYVPPLHAMDAIIEGKLSFLLE